MQQLVESCGNFVSQSLLTLFSQNKEQLMCPLKHALTSVSFKLCSVNFSSLLVNSKFFFETMGNVHKSKKKEESLYTT